MEPLSSRSCPVGGKLDEQLNSPSHGLWQRTEREGPWGWFFHYYQIQEGGTTYYRRVNKLDKAFDWICKKLYWACD